MNTRPLKLEPLLVVATAHHLGIALRRKTVERICPATAVSACLKEDLLRLELHCRHSALYLRITTRGHVYFREWSSGWEVDLDCKLKCEPGEPIQKFTTNWSDTKHFKPLLDLIEETGREEFPQTELLETIGFQMLDEARTFKFMFPKSKDKMVWVVGGKAFAGIELRKLKPQQNSSQTKSKDTTHKPFSLPTLQYVARAHNEGKLKTKSNIEKATRPLTTAWALQYNYLRVLRFSESPSRFLRLTPQGIKVLEHFDPELVVDTSIKPQPEIIYPRKERFEPHPDELTFFEKLIELVHRTGEDEFTEEYLREEIDLKNYSLFDGRPWLTVSGDKLVPTQYLLDALEVQFPQPREETDQDLGLA